MLGKVIFFFAVVIGSFVWLHKSLQDGSLLAYVDAHPNPQWSPRGLYAAGHTYYLFQDLPQAATCFWRVEAQYAKSPQADSAAFYHLQVQDDLRIKSRDELIQSYEEYLEKFPKSPHTEEARSRISSYRTGAR